MMLTMNLFSFVGCFLLHSSRSSMAEKNGELETLETIRSVVARAWGEEGMKRQSTEGSRIRKVLHMIV